MPPITRRHFLVTLSTGAASPWLAAAPAPRIAAASDLQFALPEIVEAFARSTGVRLRVTYGSSGQFAMQIEAGAAFEVFLCADRALIERLATRVALPGKAVSYALGRLVVATQVESKIALDGRLRALPPTARIAIANPEHAPYGRIAMEALTQAGSAAAHAARLVRGESAAQALKFLLVGGADLALLPLSLVRAEATARAMRFVPVEAAWYTPLDQQMVLTPKAGAQARQFFEFLQTPPIRAILDRHGLGL